MSTAHTQMTIGDKAKALISSFLIFLSMAYPMAWVFTTGI
ncbi:hypothetical protein HLRTI_000394 [Halorhabdus tiamatea SARL4B]|uniref:Uncharacterized protein n=1 Tax=Halorhabdus tiamatea SARL4B TaxID=1033806 RepID=U2E554_9EURY|nr:hypothetical protein HLRTI_000394 [Halorhabdus tiamatea SARL4B]